MHSNGSQSVCREFCYVGREIFGVVLLHIKETL